MAIDAARIRKQQALLLRLHPDLADVSVAVTSLDEAPLDAIAALIDAAWRRAYGSRIRIASSPPFLRYCAGPEPGRGFAVTLWAEGALQGVSLGLPLDMVRTGRPCPAVLTTGLCVSQAWEGRGLTERLLLEHGRALLDRNIHCGFHWRAAGGAGAGRDAGNSLAHAVSAPLYARALRLRRAAALGGLDRLETLGLGLFNGAHALRRSLDRLPGGCTVHELTEDRCGTAAAMLAKRLSDRGLALAISPEQLAWNARFDEAGIRAAGWVLEQGGNACALAWGHTNPVSETEQYFALDRLTFAPELNASARRAFVVRVERAVRERFDPFAVLMAGPVCDAAPAFLGYRSVKTYYLGATDVVCDPPLAPEELAGLPLPLR